jgi:hypothetical protein
VVVGKLFKGKTPAAFDPATPALEAPTGAKP